MQPPSAGTCQAEMLRTIPSAFSPEAPSISSSHLCITQAPREPSLSLLRPSDPVSCLRTGTAFHPFLHRPATQ